MKPVTLIAVDVDGTLLNSQKKLDEKTRQVVNRLKEYGILFGIISGRPVESGVILSRQWGIENSISFLVGMNGGAIYDMRTKEKQTFAHLDGKLVWQICEIFREIPGIHFEPMIGNRRYVEFSTPETLAIAEQFGEEEIIVDLKEFLEHHDVDKLVIRSRAEDQPRIKEIAAAHPFEGVVSFPTADVLYEYVDPKINKGFGLDRICEHYGLNEENVIAFGDESNDIEMLQKAGVGIAMGNATSPVKAIADVVLPWTNDEHGIARYLEQDVLPEQTGRLEVLPASTYTSLRAPEMPANPEADTPAQGRETAAAGGKEENQQRKGKGNV